MKPDDLHPGVLEIVDVKAGASQTAVPQAFKIGQVVSREESWTTFELINLEPGVIRRRNTKDAR
jgi:hypothetical protein